MFSKKPRRSVRSRLAIDQFDARIVPAVVLTQLDLDGDGATDDIRIVGDGQNSTVFIQDDGTGNLHINIDANSNGVSDKGDINQDYAITNNSVVLDLQLKGGKDSLAYVFTTPLAAGTRSYNLDMGGSKDVIIFQAGTIHMGSSVNMTVNGGGADDVFGFEFSNVNNSYVNVQTWMGSGNDTYNLIFGDVDVESSVNVTTDLGTGRDTHTVTIESVGYDTHADMDMWVTGGNGKDTVDVTVKKGVGGGLGDPSSHLGVNVDLGHGDDAFVGKLNGGTFILDDNSQAVFAVKGGAGNDSLKMERNGNGVLRVDTGAMFVIDLDGGLGKDTINAEFTGADAWRLETPGSRLKVRLDGADGKDSVTCRFTNDSFTKGDFDIACYGGAGDDYLWFETANIGGTPTYGPSGKVQVDGGLGKDTFVNGNPGLTSFVGIEL